MSEVSHLPESECTRFHGLLSQFVDGDLAVEQSAWFSGHLEVCAECRAELAGFAEIDGELTSWGQRLGRLNPPAVDATEQLAARLASSPARHLAIRWMAVTAAIAAGVTLAVIAPPKTPLVGNRERAPFIQIPYLPPLDPRENIAIVRMKIRVATLIAAGYRITADPNAIVPADVVVGEDGRAHAVRVLSGIDWSRTGD